jgi:putative ABC transport system ATP-binding protein
VRRPLSPVLTVALPLLLLGGACTSDDGRAVSVGRVERATVTEVVEAPGTVTARAVAAVTSPAEATVSQVLVADGTQVRRGTVLLRLDSPSATATLRAALAAQAVGGDTVSRALAASTLQSARATVDALTVRAPVDGVVTYGASAPAAAGSGDLLGSLPGALQGAASSLLGGSDDGSSVTTDDISVGAPVGEGTPLLTVTDISALGISAEVDETDVLLVSAGVRAEVLLDAVPAATYSGTVTGVDLSPQSSTRGGVGYRVRLSLTGDPKPRPGMSAVVRLQVREARDAVSVPAAAVVRDGPDDVVFLVDGGVVRRRVVDVGAQGTDRVEVRSGLAVGDEVVIRDADGLRDGPALEAVDVHRSYRLDGVQVDALRGVSMAVAEGDYVAVVGPSGSGKSTLMHLLGGLDRPTSGVLRVGGRDVAGLSEDELAEVRGQTVGFVFQAFQLLARTSAVDNVAMPLVYRGLGRAERRRRATAALESVGMGHRLGHTPNQLSGGEQQRVAIARALVGEPSVLLADEPTGNLDTRTGEDVMQLLEGLHQDRGLAVVLVTHDRDVAARADRVVAVRDGLLEGAVSVDPPRPSAEPDPRQGGEQPA